ncbi:DUF6354 family protein [Streptosporangium canum]|uniref:DUF6354 family protein n=1 Tax=Streptosporangium canum TaxID=324952 RepID=UPI00378BBE60
MTEVRPDQVWADNDSRARGRKVRVVEVDETHATVEQVDGRAVDRGKSGRRTRIRLDRFRPTSTGYVLIEDVPEVARPSRIGDVVED